MVRAWPPSTIFLKEIYTFLPKIDEGNGKIDKERCHCIQTLKMKTWLASFFNRNRREISWNASLSFEFYVLLIKTFIIQLLLPKTCKYFLTSLIKCTGCLDMADADVVSIKIMNIILQN